MAGASFCATPLTCAFSRSCASPPSPVAAAPPPLPPSFPSFSTPRTLPRHSPKLSLSSIDNTISRIQNSGVIACLRASSPELAMEAACAVLTAGISVLEIVASTPGVFEVLSKLGLDHPTATLGVGTVLNANDAYNAIVAGAKFLMSPVLLKDIMADVQSGEVLYIPGAMTPTEIFSAYDAGAKIVKVYPISALGGTQYLSAIKKPFAHIPMVASQGISLDSMGDYIAHGASAVVLSDAIFNKKAMSQCNFVVITELAHAAALKGREAVERNYREAWMRLLGAIVKKLGLDGLWCGTYATLRDLASTRRKYRYHIHHKWLVPEIGKRQNTYAGPCESSVV